jgi:hypothetical protein
MLTTSNRFEEDDVQVSYDQRGCVLPRQTPKLHNSQTDAKYPLNCKKVIEVLSPDRRLFTFLMCSNISLVLFQMKSPYWTLFFPSR